MSKEYHDYDGRKLLLRGDATLMEAVYWIADGIPPVDGKDAIYTEKARKALSKERIQEAKIQLYTDLRSGKISASGYECVPQYLTKDGSEEPLKFLPSQRKIPKYLWDFNEIEWNRGLLNQLIFSEDEPDEVTIYRSGFLHSVVKSSDLFGIYKNVKPPTRRARGCKTQILAEFKRRAEEREVSKTWTEEIKALCKFSGRFGDEYKPESMKNILTLRLFESKRPSG